MAVETLCIRLALSLQKDLPVKIADFVSSMVPESHRAKIKMAGSTIATFHHLKLDLELREPNESMKQLGKDAIMHGLVQVSQMAMGMGGQLGFIEVAKNGGVKTTAMLCLTPILSFEISLLAPTTLETLETVSAMPPPS